jgi:hypothetical protein
MMRSVMKRAALVLVLLAVSALGAAGCSDLKYYDIDVYYSGFTGATTTSTIQTCHLYVSGAESHDFYVGGGEGTCGMYFNSANPSHLGIIEYSSTASSGSLTFDMKVFNGIPEGASCQVGEGMITLTIGGMGADMTTNMDKLTVAAGGLGCHP